MEALRRLDLDPANPGRSRRAPFTRWDWCTRWSPGACWIHPGSGAKSWSSKRKRPWWKTSCAPCYTTTLASSARFCRQTDIDDHPLLSALGELRPSRVMPVLAHWLARHFPALDRRARVPTSWHRSCSRTRPIRSTACPTSALDARTTVNARAHWLRRQCRHWLPCHGGLDGPLDHVPQVPMGAEGVDWVAQSFFTNAPIASRTWAMEPIPQATWPFARQRSGCQHHLQDPVQRRGRHDRRPARGPPPFGTRNRAPGASRRRPAHRCRYRV